MILLTRAQDSQTSRQIWKTLGCLISTMIYPNPTYIFRNGWMIYPFLGKPTHKLWGWKLTSTPPHHSHSLGTTWILGGVIGRSKRILQHKRWVKCTWRSTITSSPQLGDPPKILGMLRSWLYLEWLRSLQMTQISHHINITGVQKS